MIDFSFIMKILTLDKFRKILSDKVISAFKNAFRNTNVHFKYSTEVNPDVIDYLESRELVLSQKTLDRLHGNLKFELLEGINAKEGIDEIVRRITPLFDNMQNYELERIARTEILNAQNAGEFNSMIQGGVATHKIWKANINNKRTGADSKRLHNQIQPIMEPFVDPKTGKKCQHSPNRPNCRCSIQYIYELPPKTVKKGGLLYKA